MFDLPKPLHQFIAEFIDAVETLEILLLLERTPQTLWTATAIESHLGIAVGTAEARLSSLAQHGLAVRGESGAYGYRPADERRRTNTSLLATAYRDHRVAIVNAIYGENLARLRAFTDAFKVRGE